MLACIRAFPECDFRSGQTSDIPGRNWKTSLARVDERNRSAWVPRLYRPPADRYNHAPGEVLELADRRDLGSRAARREGSSPSFPTPAVRTLHPSPATH